MSVNVALFISVPYETKPRVHPAVTAIDNLIILTDIHYNAFVIVHLLHSIHYIEFMLVHNNITYAFITLNLLHCIHFILSLAPLMPIIQQHDF